MIDYTDNALMPHEQAAAIFVQVVEHFADWPIRTGERFRNAVLHGAVGINPMINIGHEQDAIVLRNMLKRCVAEGRMIDFGYVPNEVLKTESIRARDVFEAGELQHPYEEWLGIMAWEGGMNGYLISPNPYRPHETIVVEMYGVVVPNMIDVIFIHDFVSIEVVGPGKTLVNPTELLAPEYNEEEVLGRRAANMLDPLVTMLRFLADATLPVTDVPAPDKLNRRRIAQGKTPIPAHTVVATRDYVTAFHQNAHDKGHDRGGHHASPVAHWRRAHHRTLSDGKVIPVRSAKVNWRDADELHRIFYRQKETAK